MFVRRGARKQIGSTKNNSSCFYCFKPDSLETWFLDLINEMNLNKIIVEILADDQELTLDYLKKGLASACISTSSKEIVRWKSPFSR